MKIALRKLFKKKKRDQVIVKEKNGRHETIQPSKNIWSRYGESFNPYFYETEFSEFDFDMDEHDQF